MKIYILMLLAAVSITACVEIPNRFDKLPPGSWRAVLFLEEDVRNFSKETNSTIHQIRDKELPFVFDIFYDDNGKMYAEIRNGEERIRVDDISYTKSRLNGGEDTVRIDFPLYNSYITARFNERYLGGYWVDLNRNNYRIPFKAVHGKDYRFMNKSKSDDEFWAGQWQVLFDYDKDEPYKAIGNFKQDGNVLTGTFKTETGDFRFLEGNVVDDQLFLSVFDGSHAFIFRAQKEKDGTITGIFRSGKHYESNWKATRSDSNHLASPMDLTYIKEGYDGLEFSFQTPEGKEISPSSAEYEGKAKIIQIMGTWCPNCKDESLFLSDYFRKNQRDDIAVMALAFEKQVNQKAQDAIRLYKKKLNIPYEMAVAGSYRKSEAVKALPALNAIISYPTLIFMDKNNDVRYIHTGFNGPATDAYQDFIKEFEHILQEITADE